MSVGEKNSRISPSRRPWNTAARNTRRCRGLNIISSLFLPTDSAEDPTFASAYIFLACAIHNQKRPVEEFRTYAETALRFAPIADIGVSASRREMVGRSSPCARCTLA